MMTFNYGHLIHFCYGCCPQPSAILNQLHDFIRIPHHMLRQGLYKHSTRAVFSDLQVVSSRILYNDIKATIDRYTSRFREVYYL